MFSITLVLTLIALVAFAAFLVSDIMSFNGIAIKDLQDDAVDLANQDKDQEPASALENAAANNSSREDIGTPLSSLNGSDEVKGSLSRDDIAGDTGKRPNPSAGANSSLDNASILTGQTGGTVVTIIKTSGSDSHKSDKNKKHSSPKNIQVKKDIQVNRDDAFPPITAAENQSQLNQSQNYVNLSRNLSTNLSTNLSLARLESHTNLSSTDLNSMDPSIQLQSRINLSSNLSLNLSASEPKMNAAEIPSYNSLPEDTDVSSGNSSGNSFADSVIDSSANSSANPDALSQLDMNSTITSDPNAFDADLTSAADFSENLGVSELSSVDGETSSLDADAARGMEEEVQIEPTVQVELPVQELSIENSVPPGDGEDLGLGSSDEGISDGLVDFNPDIDTNDVGVFADPVETDDWANDGADDEALPPDDVSSEPQYPEHSMTADREWPTNSQEEPAQFASSQEDKSVNGDSDFAEPTGKVVPAGKSSSKWKGAENKRLSNREKWDKTAKSLKRPTPPARPAKTRPVKPARDNSRD